MLKNLIESKPRRTRRTGGVVTSVVLHVGLIGAAVYGTLRADQVVSKPTVEKVVFVQTRPPEPTPPATPKPPPPELVAAPPPPKGFQVLAAPINIPNVIPAVDLTRPITDANDFLGKGIAGGKSDGVADGIAPPNLGETFRDFQVDKQVAMTPGTLPPHYPDAMRAANIEGDVLVTFVVDTTGRADMSTFTVIKSTHTLFTQAVKNSVANSRYYPAEIGGHRVKQLVQQPFVFSLTGRP